MNKGVPDTGEELDEMRKILRGKKESISHEE